jgi:hypothetical protein
VRVGHRGQHQHLACQLGASVHAQRAGLVVDLVWTALITAEDVIGGDMDEVRACTRAGVCDVLGSGGVDRMRSLWVFLGRVDLGVRGAVHHDVTG